MNLFLFGCVVGFIVGGFFVDVNMRAPDGIKRWFAARFGG